MLCNCSHRSQIHKKFLNEVKSSWVYMKIVYKDTKVDKFMLEKGEIDQEWPMIEWIVK